MMTLNISHQRAVGDLLQAERDLRQKSEDALRSMRQALVDTANRLDGKRLDALRREDPSIPANWTAQHWRKFFDEVSAPSQGWVKPVVPDTQALKQIAELQAALDQARQNLQAEQTRSAAIAALPPTETAIPVVSTDAAVITDIPIGATPALSVIVEDTRKMFDSFPKKLPAIFLNMLSGGGRSGGDLARVYQRYWLILYLIGHWRLSTSMELEEVLAGMVNVSAGSGSVERVLRDMEKGKILVTEILTLKSPRTALKLDRLSPEGGKLYQALFQIRPYEDDWSRLIRLHKDPQQTLVALLFAMHARKRGWATQVLPEVKGAKSVPDVWITRGEQKLYVELDLDGQEHLEQWRSQSALNGGRIAICAATQNSRARLADDCKLGQLPGMAADLETMIQIKFKEISAASPFWLMSWQ